jgi:lipopolysaccharide export system permease protein
MGLSQIDKYILRQLLAALGAVTLALVALIWLTQSLRFIELVVDRGLSMRVFFQLTSLLLPNFTAVVLPITSFAVVLATYQRLSSDREITVMRAAGLSPLALARPALLMAGIAALAGFFLTLYLVPVCATAFRDYQFEIRNKVAAFLLQEGVFTPLSQDLTVYVRARDSAGTLHGVIVQDERDPHTRATILAEEGRMVPKSETPRVTLLNGTRQEIDRNTGRLSVLNFAADTIDLSIDSKAEDQRFREVAEMALDELLHPDPRYDANHERGKLLVEAHRRLSQPLTIAGFSLLALAASLTGTFQRAGSLWRPLAASILLVVLLAAGFAAMSIATANPTMLPLVWAVSLLPGLAAALWLFRPLFIVKSGA